MNEILRKRWAVVGFDYDTAKQLMKNIESSSGKEVLRRIQGRNNLRIEFTDGTLLRWFDASDSARGYKFVKMWCDKTINKDIFECVIMPMYFGEREEIVWL